MKSSQSRLHDPVNDYGVKVMNDLVVTVDFENAMKSSKQRIMQIWNSVKQASIFLPCSYSFGKQHRN
jgi:hypothetical protein